MIVNFRYTEIKLSGWIQGVSMKEKNPIVVSSIFFKDNNKHVHWVGHSRLRSLDIDELFKRIPKACEN